jgi:hypothetical protein
MLAAALLLPLVCLAVPVWGARQSMPADTPIPALQHGEWIWLGDAVRTGPLVMVVSLDEQRGYVYRNGVAIGITTVSSGRPGHEFTILQKDKDHRSTIYDGAPMPYMERLTWGGIALHAGGLPGYPESHGCIHLPSEFARLLFEITSTGMTVVIADSVTQPTAVNHPGFLAPVSTTGTVLQARPLQQTESTRWQPELSPTGPVSVILSRVSGRAIVYRNGIEIGRSRVVFRGSEPIGTHALILAAGAAANARFVPDPAAEHWLRVGIAGRSDEASTEPDPASASRIDLPDDFLSAVYAVLEIGSTVLVTDEAITAATTGPKLDVVNADPPEGS